MKFVEAVQLTQSLPGRVVKGRLWLLASYNPFILNTYLQAALIQNASEKAGVYRIQTADYDQLFESLNVTSSGDSVFEPAVLSLIWEDFNPSLGWRGRVATSSSVNKEWSQVIRDAIIHWAGERKRKGISIVLLPPENWLPNDEALPSLFMDDNRIIFDRFKTELASELIRLGCFVLEVKGLSMNLREMLHAGSPWTMDNAKDMGLKLAKYFEPANELIKAVVVDLDNTLWGGVLEDGSALENAKAEWKNGPFKMFAKILLSIQKRGIFLGCSSKNDLEEVRGAFGILQPSIRFEDFNAVSVHWGPKSRGLREISEKLNILPQNILFIDDNPAELLEVKSIYPDVLTLQTPRELNDWLVFFEDLKGLCFVPRNLTEEDHLRVQRRTTENDPKFSETSSQTSKNYLKSLKLRLKIRERAWEEPRTLELVNKTNQFNLNGLRQTPQGLQEYRKKADSWCLAAKLSDTYGEFGTISVLMGRYDKSTAAVKIDTFVLSCRVFDRNVEYALLYLIFKKFTDAQSIEFCAQETPKNRKMIQFLGDMGLSGPQWALKKTAVTLDLLREKIESAGLEIMEEA